MREAASALSAILGVEMNLHVSPCGLGSSPDDLGSPNMPVHPTQEVAAKARAHLERLAYSYATTSSRKPRGLNLTSGKWAGTRTSLVFRP